MERDGQDPMPREGEPKWLVMRIMVLSAKYDSGEASRSDAEDLINALSSLAALLRDEQNRISLEGSALAPVLIRCLYNSSQVPDRRDETLEQVGRVAANFGADNETNMDALTAAMYQRTAVGCLALNGPLPVLTARALVASVLNAVIFDHALAMTALCELQVLSALIKLARQYMSPQAQTPESGSEAAASVGLWLWRIISDLAEFQPHALLACWTSENVEDFMSPTKPFMPTLADTPPSVAGLNDQYESYLSALDHWRECLDAVCSIEKDDKTTEPFLGQLYSRDRVLLNDLLDFIECATIPVSWDLGSDSDNQMEGDTPAADKKSESSLRSDYEKRLGKVKASVVGMIGRVSWELPYVAEDEFWARMRLWANRRDERDDLISCALLALGNGAHKASSAESLLSSSATMLPQLLERMVPSTKVTIQHSVIGLLRNLAVPKANRVILGDAGLIARICQMGVFDDKHDMVESVQGGAAALLKILCDDNPANAARFAHEKKTIKEMLAMMKRVDSAPVIFETSRIFVNCIKSLAHDPKSKHIVPIARMSRTDIIEVYVELLRRTIKYPLLTNDAMISLALVTTFGPGGTGLNVFEQLKKERPAAEGEPSSGAAVIKSVIAPDSKFSTQMKENASTLLWRIKESCNEDLFPDSKKHDALPQPTL